MVKTGRKVDASDTDPKEPKERRELRSMVWY